MFKRLIIAYFFLFLFISIYFAYTSITFTSEILDDLATKNAKRLVYIVLDQNKEINDQAILSLKRIVGGEIFIYSKAGDLLLSSIKKEAIPQALKKLTKEELETLKAGPIVKKITLNNQKYRFIIFEAKLTKNISAYFGILLPTTTEEQIKANLIFGLIYTSFAGLVFMLVVSWLLSRSITQPLEELAEETRQIGRGKWKKIPEKGPAEVKSLARALNQMSQEIKEYQQRLLEAERLSTTAQLAASIAHEIKNPLTSLKLASEILCEFAKDNPTLSKRAQMVLSETARLEKILQNMLAKTKKIQVVREVVDVNALVKEVTRMAENQFKARKQKFTVELAEQPIKISADPEKIKQVLWNILNNAWEATPEEGEIKVRTELTEKGAEIIVEDSGPGIPEDRAKDLFRPFYSTKPGGTGLGLAVSRQIVLFHGGELILENREEGGARVRVILPPLSESRD
ncbi:ATP-binding protein [Thermodesulfatator indicus]